MAFTAFEHADVKGVCEVARHEHGVLWRRILRGANPVVKGHHVT